MPQNNAFQVPQSQVQVNGDANPFIPTQATSQMLAPQASGMDAILQYVQGRNRLAAEQAVADQAAASAAEQAAFEREKFDATQAQLGVSNTLNRDKLNAEQAQLGISNTLNRDKLNAEQAQKLREEKNARQQGVYDYMSSQNSQGSQSDIANTYQKGKSKSLPKDDKMKRLQAFTKNQSTDKEIKTALTAFTGMAKENSTYWNDDYIKNLPKDELDSIGLAIADRTRMIRANRPDIDWTTASQLAVNEVKKSKAFTPADDSFIPLMDTDSTFSASTFAAETNKMYQTALKDNLTNSPEQTVKSSSFMQGIKNSPRFSTKQFATVAKIFEGGGTVAEAYAALNPSIPETKIKEVLVQKYGEDVLTKNIKSFVPEKKELTEADRTMSPLTTDPSANLSGVGATMAGAMPTSSDRIGNML